jgi:hypothetical protein
VKFEQAFGRVEGGGAGYGMAGIAEQFEHARERTVIVFDDKDLVRKHRGDTFLTLLGGRRKGYAAPPPAIQV